MLPQVSFFTPALSILSLSPALAIIPPIRIPALVVENGLLKANTSGQDHDLPLTNLNASPQCNGARYGRNLRSASCDEVLELFDSAWDDPVMEFGQRGIYLEDNKVPVRWLSSDGLCALDVVLKSGVWQDRSHQSKLWDAAKAIVDRCVKGAPASRNAGGATGDLGENRGLIVIIRSYQPQVSCTAPVGQPTHMMQGECQDIVATLPVSHQIQIFGTARQRAVQVALPMYFTSAREECIGYLTAPDDTRFTSSSYDVWAAASAIDNMCVRNGKTGMAKVTETRQGSLLLALTKLMPSGSNMTSGDGGNSSRVIAFGAKFTANL